MIVKNIDDFKGLRAVNRMAVFLSVFLPRSKGIQELTELLYSGFPQVTVSSVASNVEDLRRQGLLCKPDRCYERFAFCTAWTLEALKAMKAEADAKNWWPTRALLQKAQHKGEHRYGGIRKDPPFELALTDGICLFLLDRRRIRMHSRRRSPETADASLRARWRCPSARSAPRSPISPLRTWQILVCESCATT